ncbi:MAG: MarR family transcriptional regulator [Proteobacteria bacterium]|nr:MarR family transcriptional regulator [Pseudomonadota bacterium]
MTDIISAPKLAHGDAVALVELLFFAYRDFVADPDGILEKLEFGRAHHRVLHFVGRDPGMNVAQLLDILRITKQSLARVLKELIEKGYVYQKAGEEDRRQRLLYLTGKGEGLWQELVAPQTRRFQRAVSEMQMEDGTSYHEMFLRLINPENRQAVEEWAARAVRGQQK